MKDKVDGAPGGLSQATRALMSRLMSECNLPLAAQRSLLPQYKQNTASGTGNRRYDPRAALAYTKDEYIPPGSIKRVVVDADRTSRRTLSSILNSDAFKQDPFKPAPAREFQEKLSTDLRLYPKFITN